MNEKKEQKVHTPNSRLRDARIQKGWSQKELADRINLLDTRNIGRWERGETFPRPYNRRDLCQIFEKSLEELGLLESRTSTDDQRAAPLVSQPEPLWNVPTFFTSFVGHERDIAAICTLLEDPEARLLTLLGPGGIGKTRLAVELAGEMREDFDAGVCYVSLSGISDPALVLPTIAQESGIQERGDTNLFAHLKRLIGKKQLLLILDNFEQVVESALLIEQLLAASPGLKILVTSRVVLDLQAEHEFALSPLALPDLSQALAVQSLLQTAAVALFVQRARLVHATFQLTQENVQTIAQICMHLDGLPLAIELAAARIKLLSARDLLTQITSHRFSILTSKSRSLPDRHLTIYNTVKWSYDLLDEQEQWLFCQLAVFTGGATLEAVEKVCRLRERPDLDVLSVLESLMNKSLLQRSDGEGEDAYFTMLETIREYGLERLHTLEALEPCQQAYTTYYMTLIEQAEPHLKGSGQRSWLARLEHEKENLRSVLTWLIEQKQVEQALLFCEVFGKFCGLRGYWSEEELWLDAVLLLAESAPPSQAQGKVLRRAGHLEYRFRHLTKARSLLERSIVISQRLNDPANLAGSLLTLGRVLYRQKDITSARRLFQESVAVARSSGDKWALANALDGMGSFAHAQGSLDEAHQLLLESIALAREVGDKETMARILGTLLNIEMGRGSIEQAILFARESFALAEELGNKPQIALALDSLAEIASVRKAYEEAKELIERRIRLAYELDDHSTLALNRLKLGKIALEQEQFAEAKELAQESLALFRTLEDNPNIASAQIILGDIERAQQAFAPAIESYRLALHLEQELGAQSEIGRCLLGLIQIFHEQGRSEQIVWLLSFAQTWSERTGQMLLTGEHQRLLTEAHTLLGQEIYASAWSAGQQMTYTDLLERLISD